jgi:hypothetical protein
MLSSPPVRDIAAVDAGDDGKDEILVLDPSGELYLLDPRSGSLAILDSMAGKAAWHEIFLASVFEVPRMFLRGDADGSGAVDITDAIAVLDDIFLGRPAPASCRDALDANDDGTVDISDPIFVLSFLFLGGPPLRPPYPEPGIDPTPDDLGCR